MKIRALGIVAVVAGAVAAPAHADPSRTAAEAVEHAYDAAIERDPACGLPGTLPPPTMSDAAPGPALTEQLAILRRPQTEADVAGSQIAASYPGEVLRPGIRVVQGPDGRAYELFVVAAGPPRPAVCAAVEDRVVRRTTRTARLKVRREARALLAVRRAVWERGERVVITTLYGGAAGLGAGTTAAQLAAGFAGPEASGMVAGQPTLLYGLVRDGVASVTWRFTGGHEATAPVQDNIAAVEVGFLRFGVMPERTILRDASGAVIADVPAPGRR